MRRRAFLSAAAAMLVPQGHAFAQPAARAHRIGLVSTVSAGANVDAFMAELKRLGYAEKRNLVIEARYAQGRLERVPALVAEVLRAGVDVLVVSSTAGALAAKQATATVPVVFINVSDPVGQGIVASLARPGGNLTGTTFGVAGAGFAGKWVELLKEAVPRLAHVAVLWNSSNAGSAAHIPEIRAAASKLNVKVELFDAGDARALERAIADIQRSPVQGLVVAGDPFLTSSRDQLVRFAAKRRLPAMYFFSTFVESGGLMSYGWDMNEIWGRAAVQAHKILQGANPAEIPVEQPTRSELVINLRTAWTLGLEFPAALLVRADRVIE